MVKKRVVIGLGLLFLAIAGIIINIDIKKHNEIAIAAAKETSHSDLAFAVLGDVHNNIDIEFAMKFKKAGASLEAIREYIQLAMQGESTKAARLEILLSSSSIWIRKVYKIIKI